MLDLDALAQKQASHLKQSPDAWVAAIWSEGFQKLSQSMSDGEVEELIAICPSAKQLDLVVQLLTDLCQTGNIAPFTALTEQAAKAGLKPHEWVSGLK